MKFYRLKKLLLLYFLFIINSSCTKQELKADVIVLNATIWTADASQKTAEAMGIHHDTILAIGTFEEIKKLQSKTTKVVDAKGKFLMPSFIDSHVHLMMGGNSLLSVSLRDAATPEEFTKRIADFANTLKSGTWILEGNWDHTLWGGELPKKEWIDQFTRENPVVIYRLDGHMVLANSAALEYAGINQNTKDVENGEIVRDENGFPTGILKSNAMNLVLDKIPPLTETEKDNALKAATNYFLSHGVTTVHDVDSLGGISAYQRALKKDQLGLRVYSIDPLSRWDEAAKKTKFNSKWLKTGAVKGFVDGSLGSHTAAFKEPYSDKPNYKGFFINSKENLYQWISNADKENLQILVHAIGDNAIYELLNCYERIIKENGVKDRRLRLEHAQHISKEDIERFAKLGVIASMQPFHAIDDGRWAEAYIGSERIKTTYAFNSLLKAKTEIVFGSDWPVAPGSPITGIYAAVTRRTLDDKNLNGWVPEQKISVQEALMAYTQNGAYASFEEHLKGSLTKGKLADFIILSENPFEVKPVDLNKIEVLETYLGGKKVFEKKP